MPQSNSGHSMFGAIAMLVVGLVIFIPSGLCTGVFAFGSSGMNFLPLALLIGGPFVLGGFLLIWNGIKRIREIKQDSES